jgi:uncharacterized protein (DUF4415 family)
MAKQKPLTDAKGEIRGLTAEDIKRARPFSSLPEVEQRGPQKAPTKELVSIRLSRDVVERLRASGHGWQSRVDTVLRGWLKHKRA